MARWISVTATDSNEDTLINLDNVSAIQGRVIFFVGGGAEAAKESHTELVARVALAEGEGRYMTPETRKRAERVRI